MIMGIVSVLVMLAAILALAHLGDAESFMANLGSPLPAFGTVLDPPPEVECNAPAILPNLTFTESDIGITPIATIRDGGDFVLVAADAIAVYEADGRAYALVVTNPVQALQIINITDPANPSSSAIILHGGDFVLPNVQDVAVHEAGGRAYAVVKSDGGAILQILDITDPANPAAVSTIRHGGDFKIGGVGDVIIHEADGRAYALVAADSIDGVQFIDITDPANPSAVAAVRDDMALPGSIWGIAIHKADGRAYALATISNSDAVQIIDITDPANPSAVAIAKDDWGFELGFPVHIAIYEAGGRAYALVASSYDDAVQIIDITDPARPAAAATIRDGGDFELDDPVHIAIYEAGGRAYAIVAARGDDAVQIIDITDPARPAAAVTIRDGGDFELDDPMEIAIYETGGLTYILVSSYACSAVQIMQIDAGPPVMPDAENPVDAGTIPPPLAHVRDGITTDKVACSDSRVLMASPSGNPACVFAESVDVLERRGFVLPSDVPRENLSSKQPASEKAGGTNSPDVSKTGDRPFVTTWRTTSPNESITIPVGNATGTYTVSWGDGTTSPNVTGDQIHAYEGTGTYTVAITGNFERIYLNGNQNNAPKLQSIEQWGDASWASMNSAFNGASNMAYNAADSIDLSDVTDMSGMFHDASSFNGDVSEWDVSHVTDMSDMFHGAFSFNRDLSKWDVSNVTDMSGMFTGGLVGDAPGGGGISSAPSVPFYYASSFNGDISEWDVSKVNDMSDMFHYAHHFNGDLSSWDVSGVTDMSGMFYGASSFNGSISKWDVSHVTDMSDMFHGVFRFNSDLSSWDVSGVTDMSYMFLSSRFNGDLSSWDVSGVTYMSHMFARTYSFSSDLSEWDVSGVTDMSKMFFDTNSFNSNLSSWDVSGVTDMSGMFQDASRFNSDLSSWDVSGVTDMSGMFSFADSFNSDLSSWDVSGVTDMSDMFHGSRFNSDLSSWDVSSVTSMHQMFHSSRFNSDLSSWDVSSVTGMGGMFNGASRFNSDLSSWDVSSVTYMGGMFNDAHSFNSDLSSWDVSSVTDMFAMFSGADSFNGNISTWDVSSVFRTLRMFYEADSFNGDLSSWDVSGMTDMLAMFHGASSFSQNLGNWYIVLDNASIDIDSGAMKIGNIAAQNQILDRQYPVYGIGSGADSALFVIDRDDLMIKPSVDYSGKTGYAVNITSTGDFGKNNFRVINVTVTGAAF